MPIRLVPDKKNTSQSQKKSGGFSPWMLLVLPLIFRVLKKRPKLLILLVIIGAVWYFWKGKDLLNDGGNTYQSHLTTGCEMKQSIFDKADVYEPLAYGFNSLPSSIDLSQYCPDVKNQMHQGSCVGWASSYAARTILQAKATGRQPNSVAFSPSSLYNQIKLDGCQGAYINNAMEVMRTRGVLPYSEFPYNPNSCAQLPSGNQVGLMSQFRTKGYQRLTKGGNNYEIDLQAIKQNLAQGAPVVIGMLVGNSFMQPMNGKKLWRPSRSDYNMSGFGGHAMCVVGYDDNQFGGAFKIMNSWGKNWGDQGFGWVTYNDFSLFTKEAYGLYPMGNAQNQQNDIFEVEMGLLLTKTQKLIGFRNTIGNAFQTTVPINISDKFKILVKNSMECYIYVLGMESNQSTYVLFPYTEKHSPYCGITGTRLFPKEESLQADNIGTKDYMAIVVSKEPINIQNLKNNMNGMGAGTFQQKINAALGSSAIQNVKFSAGESIYFKGKLNGKNAIASIFEIDKK